MIHGFNKLHNRRHDPNGFCVNSIKPAIKNLVTTYMETKSKYETKFNKHGHKQASLKRKQASAML